MNSEYNPLACQINQTRFGFFITDLELEQWLLLLLMRTASRRREHATEGMPVEHTTRF
jgi:hypothetical protein